MKLSFYEKLINSIEKFEAITMDEKHDKADAIVAITKIILKRGGSVVWNKKKWKVTDKAEPTYILTYEDTIHVMGSGGVKLNEKIRQEELYEYSIVHRKSFIDELIGWISEAGDADKMLMRQDLEMLMGVEDDYIFISNSTNSYITKSDSNFNETCEELIKLNESL